MSWSIRSDQNGSEFAHYGVLGMKWGVRRTPEQLGHHKLKKGTTVYRSTVNPNEKESGHAYVSYLPPDRDYYRGPAGEGLKKTGKSDRLYESTYVLKEDLNIAGRDDIQKVVNDIFHEKKTQQELGKVFADRLLSEWDFYETSENMSKWYDKNGNFDRNSFLKSYASAQKDAVDRFLKEIGDAPAITKLDAVTKAFGQSDWLKQQAISRLSAKGFNAMSDEASIGGKISPREGVDPIIVFDRSSSLDKVSSSEISSKMKKVSTRKYNKWFAVANSAKNRKNQW